MPTYTVRHRYGAMRDGQRIGPWTAGMRIELDQADAEWVERDSPGALAPYEPQAEAVAVQTPDDEAPATAPASDPEPESAPEPDSEPEVEVEVEPAEREAKPKPNRQAKVARNRSI